MSFTSLLFCELNMSVLQTDAHEKESLTSCTINIFEYFPDWLHLF